MPSFDHEILIKLFRGDPRLAVELLRISAGLHAQYEHLHAGESNLSQLVPVEFRADFVVLLRDSHDRVALGVIVEVQRSVDPDKLLSWPPYVANLRSEHRCPVILLVITPDRRVARWARQSIELGHPGFQLTPIVFGPDEIPRISDASTASALPEMSMLSALVHDAPQLAKIAFRAIEDVPKERRAVYLNALNSAFAGLDPAAPGGPDEHW